MRRAVKPKGIPPMSEKAWQALVVELARLLGWTVWHHRVSIGTRAGLPDLILMRRSRLIWAELKRDGGRLTSEQEGCIARLREAGQEAYIWRPENFDDVNNCLTRETK